MDFLLDPYVIALPDKSASPREVEEYLYSLSEWTQAVVANGHKFWLSEPIVDVLSSANIYPSYSDVQALYIRYDKEIEIFDAATVSRACQNIFTPPYIDIEFETQIPELVELNFVNHATFVIPDEVSKRLSPDVSDALEYTLAKLGYIKENYSIELAQQIVFATRCLDVDEISVKANFKVNKEQPEVSFEAKWEIICDPSQLEDIEIFWSDTNRALEWARKSLVADGTLDPKIHVYPKRWKVSRKFNDSIRKNHFDKKDLLENIFLTVTKVLSGYEKATIETDKNHHLVGKNHKQITRDSDNAKAWRIHVCEVPTVRLHYWQARDKYVEFSLVCVHEYYGIE